MFSIKVGKYLYYIIYYRAGIIISSFFWSFLSQEFIEVGSGSTKQNIPDVPTPCVVPDIEGVMVIVKLDFCYQRDDPHGTPVDSIPTVILSTEQYLVDNPEEEGEAVHFTPQNHKD